MSGLDIVVTNEGENFCTLATKKGARLELSYLIPFASSGVTLPIIQLGYTLDQLSQISVVFREMRKRRQVPQVWIWNETKGRAMILVYFGVYPAPLELVHDAVGWKKSKEIASIREWHCLNVISQFSIDRVPAELFLDRFTRAGFVSIVINEAGVEADSPVTMIENLNPLYRFDTTQLFCTSFFEQSDE